VWQLGLVLLELLQDGPTRDTLYGIYSRPPDSATNYDRVGASAVATLIYHRVFKTEKGVVSLRFPVVNASDIDVDSISPSKALVLLTDLAAVSFRARRWLSIPIHSFNSLIAKCRDAFGLERLLAIPALFDCVHAAADLSLLYSVLECSCSSADPAKSEQFAERRALASIAILMRIQYNYTIYESDLKGLPKRLGAMPSHGEDCWNPGK